MSFVSAYVRTGCGAHAAIEAGFSPNGAAVTAHRLLRRREVQALVRIGQVAWTKAFEVAMAEAAREHARRLFDVDLTGAASRR